MKLNKLVLTSALALALAGAGAVSAQGGPYEVIDGVYYTVVDGAITRAEAAAFDTVEGEDIVTPYQTYTREDNTLAVGERQVIQEGQPGIVEVTHFRALVDGVPTITSSIETPVQTVQDEIIVVGTMYVAEDVEQTTPTGEVDEFDYDEDAQPLDVVDVVDGVKIHTIQQGDLTFSGRLDVVNEDIRYVIIEKNGKVIGEGAVDDRGYFTVELTEAIQYGNIIDVYGVNAERDKVSNANFGEHEVTYVAPNRDAINPHFETADAGLIEGRTRPFDFVILTVRNANGTVVLDDLVIKADENGYWSFDSSEVIRDGYTASVRTVDSAGNGSETVTVEIGDTSALSAPDVRRAYGEDLHVTVDAGLPYATVTVIRDNGDTVTAEADSNGIVRLKLSSRLVTGETFKVVVQDTHLNRADSEITYKVTRGADNVKPQTPTIDTVAEGQTLITGTAEPFTLIQAIWTDQISLQQNEIYALADGSGNWFIDLLQKGLAPFEAGKQIYVRSIDNRQNYSPQTVETAVAATEAVHTSEPIVVSPNGTDINILDPNDEDNAGELPVDGDEDNEEENGDNDNGDDDNGKPAKPGRPAKPVASASGSKAELPETGESSQFAIYGAAALSILAGLGLVAPKFKKEN